MTLRRTGKGILSLLLRKRGVFLVKGLFTRKWVPQLGEVTHLGGVTRLSI